MPTDDTNDTTDLHNASAALRALIQFLSRKGVPYSALAQKLDKKHNWTKDAIKQLVARKASAIRENEKNRALASEVYYQIVHRIPAEKRDGTLQQNLDAAYRFVGDTEHEARFLSQKLTTKIGSRFQKLRRDSTKYDFPDTLAFARFDWKNARIIVLLVKSRASDKGYSFTMKIEGRKKNRRVILGDILHTLTNTYFSGLAYDVHKSINSQAFFEANAFDFDAISELIDPNEIGLECFAISSTAIRRSEMPVAFHGLDGRGNPTSGVGLVIRPDLFERYGISESKFAADFNKEDNPRLAKALETVSAVTVSPRLYDDEGDPVLSA